MRTGSSPSTRTPDLRAVHEAFLPEKPRHRLGDVDVDEAVAAVKLNDAETLEDACAWLKPKERVAVLGDRALIAMLARLPSAAAAEKASADTASNAA